MIPIEQKAPPGDRTAAEWNHVAYATRRRRRILLRRILSYGIGNSDRIPYSIKNIIALGAVVDGC